MSETDKNVKAAVINSATTLIAAHIQIDPILVVNDMRHMRMLSKAYLLLEDSFDEILKLKYPNIDFNKPPSTYHYQPSKKYY